MLIYSGLMIVLQSITMINADLPSGMVTFAAEPDRFIIGRNFLVKCNVQLQPNDNAWRYRVTYLLNDVEIGQFLGKINEE